MINIESIKTENGKIHVSVSLTPFCNRHFRNHISCDTAALEQLLKEKKVAHGKCIKEAYLLNRREKTCTGTWIFEKPQAPKTNSQKKTSQNRRSKKREKSLDKTDKDVIINNREKTSEE